MVKRVLVALAILPLVGDLACGSGAAVRLLHVAPVPASVVMDAGRIVTHPDEEMKRLEREWRDSVPATHSMPIDAPIEPIVRFGDPAEEILTEASAFSADLIVITTACRTGGRRLLGTVAEQLLRRARAPVLLLRPGAQMTDLRPVPGSPLAAVAPDE